MHPVISTILACFLCVFYSADAQTQWKRIDQKALNITYEIPDNWFMSGYREGAECNCSGGSLNASPDGHVKLVIFSSKEVSMDSLKHQLIGRLYRFQENELLPEIYKNDYFRFEKKENATKTGLNNDLVIRLTGYHQEHNYVIYIISTREYREQLAPITQRIMESLEPYEKEEY